MSGIVIRVPGVFTAPDLPKYVVDPRLSAGSLLLLDLTHSQGGIDRVPANGGTIPNIAWREANALVAGAPGQSALAATFATSDVFPSATFPVAERTPKLGLHLIRSKVNDVNGKYAAIGWPEAVKTYLLANKDHAFFEMALQRITRPVTSSAQSINGISLAGNNTPNLIIGLGVSGTLPAGPIGSVKIVGKFTGNPDGALSAGPLMMEVAVTQPTGSVTAIGSNAYIFGGTGNGGPFNGLNTGASQIFYSMYLEDLTVTAAAQGITITQRANDLVTLNAAYYASMFGTGGKLDGDTWTDPSGYP